MIEKDNPAGRLHEILSVAYSYRALNIQSRAAWARVFDIPVENPNNPILSPQAETAIITRLLELRKLVDETEEALRKIEGLNLDRYLKPFTRIRQAIPLSQLMESSSGQINQITESDLTILEFCAERLSERHIEQVVDEETLKKLLADVADLFNEVKAATLPADLKTFILQQLETIHRAIQEYRIRGAARLREALASIIGSIVIDDAVIKRNSDKEEVGKLRKVFYRFVSMIEFATKAAPLIKPAGKVVSFLLSGDPDVPPVDVPPLDQ